VLAVVLFMPRQRRRTTADDARRLHDLARVALLGSGLAAVALLIGRLVTSAAGGASFVSPVSSALLVVAVLTAVVSAVLFFVVAPAPRD
jgi:cation transporter-like permease